MNNKTKYREWIERHPNQVHEFYKPYWLDIVCLEWDVALSTDSQGSINGYWPYAVYKKLVGKCIFNPLFLPHLGPVVIYPPDPQKTERKLAFEKSVLSKLCDQLPSYPLVKIKIAPQLTNWLPLHWKGFEQTSRYTYQLNLNKANEISAGYTTAIRKAIRSVPQGITVSQDYDMHDVVELMQSSFDSQDFHMTFDSQKLVALDNILRQHNKTVVRIAKRADDTPIGAAYVFISNRTAYLPIIGRGDLREEEKDIIKLLIHECIVESMASADIFDFEGSMVAQFEKVFRSYGSDQVPYHVVSRVNNPVLRWYFGRR